MSEWTLLLQNLILTGDSEKKREDVFPSDYLELRMVLMFLNESSTSQQVSSSNAHYNKRRDY